MDMSRVFRVCSCGTLCVLTYRHMGQLPSKQKHLVQFVDGKLFVKNRFADAFFATSLPTLANR
eukprot:5076596-Amphidinium_carterae.1